MKGECEATDQAMKTQQDALAAAEAGLAAAKQRVEAADAERQELEKTREDFASVRTELWEPLKASELQKSWQERNRKVKQLMEKFQAIGVEPSLLEAAAMALKMKADARGEFALVAVACAEEAYAKHMEALTQRVDNFGAELSTRAAAVTEAEAVVRKEHEAVNAAMEASCAAQNTWVEETDVHAAHEAKMKAYEPTAAELQEKIAAARVELAHLEVVVGTFDSLKCNKTSEPVDAAAAPVSAMVTE